MVRMGDGLREAHTGLRLTEEEAWGFAAFREAVFDDHHLAMRLRPPLARDAYVAHVVAVGAELGFRFEAADVRAAMRVGEDAWLMQGIEVVA